MINKKFIAAVVLALVLLTGLVVSCDGDADMFLRETDKVYIARVGLIGDDIKLKNAGKDLASTKYFELDIDMITEESDLTQYFDGHPTTIIFQGIKSIDCAFTSEQFSKVGKIIFSAGDDTYPADTESVCANAFFEYNKPADTEKQLRQVVFCSETPAEIGDHAFGSYVTEGGVVNIIVETRAYVEENSNHDADDDPKAGNYRYFAHEPKQIIIKDVARKIYLAADPGDGIDEIDANLVEYYTRSDSVQTILISILPEKDNGRIDGWVPLTTASNASDSLAGVTCEKTNPGQKWYITIPAGLDEDFVLAVNKWLPDDNYSVLTIDANWPEWAKRSAANASECADGQIMVIVNSAQAYFTSPTTIPKDANGKPVAVWYGVSVSSETDSSLIFEEKDGLWKIRTEVVPPFIQNGSWIFDTNGGDTYAGHHGSDEDPITMYAQWMPIANDIGVLFHYNFQDGTSKTSFAPQRSSDRKVVTPTDVQELIDNGRKGYVFTGWFTENPVWTNPANPFVFADSDKLTTITNVYAHWEAVKVDVAFNGNENEHTVSKMPFVTTKTNADYNSAIGLLPEPVRMGYKFEGWYSAKDGGNKIESSTAINVANMPEFDFATDTDMPRPMATLFAHWTPYKTTIKLYGHQTTLTDETMPDTDGEVVYEFDKGFYTSAIAVTTPTTGHMIDSFYDEWTTASNRVLDEFMMLVSGTDYVSATDNGVCVWVYCDSADNTLELHTIWAESKGFLLRFFRNWTTTETVLVDAQRIIKGEKTTATDTNAEWMKTGYNFMGWFTTRTTFSDLTPAEVSETRFDFTTSITDNYDLYALWEPITYKIVFDSSNPHSGGTISNQPGPMENVRYDQEIMFNTVPTMSGYDFVGWAKTAMNQYYGLYSYLPYTSYSNLTTSDTDTVTLYAVWDVSESSVSVAECQVILDLGSKDTDGSELYAYRNGVRIQNPKAIFTSNKLGELKECPQNTSYKSVIANPNLILMTRDDGRGVQKFAGKHIDGFYTQKVGGVKILEADLTFADWDLTIAQAVTEAYNYVIQKMVPDGSGGFVKKYYWRGGGATLYAHWN